MYESALALELTTRGHDVRRQVFLPIAYKGTTLDESLRLDLVVADSVVVEVKAVESLARIHEAQLLTYLRVSGRRVGLLVNFNVPVLHEGIRRLIV